MRNSRVTAPKFKDRHDQSVHVVLSLSGRRVKRVRAWTLCARRVADMVRLAPHSDIRKEPPITCTICVNGLVAFDDICEKGN